MVDDGNVPTLVLDTAPTASGGANDMVHVTGDDAGFYDLELAAANVNYLGRAMLAITDAATHCPVFHEFMILPAMIYDAMVLGTDVLQADVTQLLGTPWLTPGTAGIPDVNTKLVGGQTASASGTVTFPNATLASTTNITAAAGCAVASLGADVITAASIADGAIDRATFAADTGLQTIRSNTAAAGGATSITLDASASATNDFYNNNKIYITGGTGAGQDRTILDYVGGTQVATVRAWITNPDNTSTFAILPATSTWDDILADHLTSGSTGAGLNSASSAGDPWNTALPGAYGAGTAGFIVGTNLDALITSRMATYTQPTNFLTATFPTGTIASTTNITAGTITTTTNVTNLVTANVTQWGGSTTPVTNFNTVYNTDFATVYDATNKAFLSKLGDFAMGGSSLALTTGAISATTLATSGTTTLNALTVSNATTLTGAVSLGSTLGITGTTTLAAVTSSGTVTFNALTVSNATTLTGAVSLGSTLGVTGATTLAGVTTSGTVTFNALTVTNGTTLTGAVSAANASNNIVGIDVAKFSGDSTAADNAELFFDGTGYNASASTIGTATTLTNDPTGVTTLLTRLSAARAGYMDNLNVGGAVASQADITALNQSASRRLILATVAQYERPESGSSTYTVELRTYDGDGAATNADSDPTLTATGIVSGSLAANLSAITNPATGVYRWTYTVSSAATVEQVSFNVSATMSTAFTLTAYTQVVNLVSATWTSTDASNLTAIFNKLPSKSYLTGTANTDGDVQMDEATGNFPGSVASVAGNVTGSIGSLAAQAKADVNAEADAALADVGVTTTRTGYLDNLSAGAVATASALATVATNVSTALSRLGSITGTGVNTVLGFFKALLSKTASTPSDIGGTFDPAFDSTEAIRDRGDAAWITATGFAVAGDAMALTSSERGSVADKFLGRTVTGAADGGRTVAEYLQGLCNKIAFDIPTAGKATLYATDDTTPLRVFDYTASAAAYPVTSLDPT